jgi:hypothetical protein
MTNEQLSPAAQAVMIAATNGNFNVVNDPVYKQCIAAALKAAADQVVPATTWPEVCKDHRDYFGRKQVLIRDKLLAIAAELEGK